MRCLYATAPRLWPHIAEATAPLLMLLQAAANIDTFIIAVTYDTLLNVTPHI